MKLLFDENLSPELVANLTGEFPDSIHVRDIGLERAMDEAVWSFERDNGFVIVSKDSDFHQLSFLFGHPEVRSAGRRDVSGAALVGCISRLGNISSVQRFPMKSGRTDCE